MYQYTKSIKNMRTGPKPTPTSTYNNNIDGVNDSNNFKKLLSSPSTNQHQYTKSIKNIRTGTKPTPTSTYNNNIDGVNDSNNFKKLLSSSSTNQLAGLAAYGIYRPRPYYTPLERRFRAQKGYDDNYLIKIFEDYDYVILLKILKIDSVENFVISPPRTANVIIFNQKHFVGGENFIQMIEIDKLYERKTVIEKKIKERLYTSKNSKQRAKTF
ncbi:hypothetical protein X798_03943 [Onchocerca flexuosa]|uniref:Uncharacterized protein n=1 Tax=Onchocerca flexuosa TaxID=387005 RepID=A0A238BUP3_9BILA|nr:hypothetical protein X798_03943 [Onchocerca flexuosa]